MRGAAMRASCSASRASISRRPSVAGASGRPARRVVASIRRSTSSACERIWLLSAPWRCPMSASTSAQAPARKRSSGAGAPAVRAWLRSCSRRPSSTALRGGRSSSVSACGATRARCSSTRSFSATSTDASAAWHWPASGASAPSSWRTACSRESASAPGPDGAASPCTEPTATRRSSSCHSGWSSECQISGSALAMRRAGASRRRIRSRVPSAIVKRLIIDVSSRAIRSAAACGSTPPGVPASAAPPSRRSVSAGASPAAAGEASSPPARMVKWAGVTPQDSSSWRCSS